VSGRFVDLWIYLMGPAIGSILAVALARLLRGPTPADDETREAAQGSRGSEAG
jgi:hypothetical protein